MQVYQATEVLLETYPVDPKLHDIIVNNVNPPDFGDDEWNSRQKYQMSPWDSSHIKEFRHIAEVALGIANDACGTYEMKLTDVWGQLYNEGDFQEMHNHIPNNWSFCYYVNTPEGSAPMIFDHSKAEIHPREGMLVVLPAWLDHSVPENKCKGRSIIAGSFAHTENPNE